jgi:hypothetical protein
MKRMLGFGYALVAVLCFALFGCDSSVSRSDPKAYSQDFFDRVYGKGKMTVIDCGAFVEKRFGDKTYEVAKANVSGKNGFGGDVESVMGLVVDHSKREVYALPLEDFDKFLTDGDTSAFPKIVDLTVK